MSAETANLAITWFDWAKIIIPPLITASIALGAAFLAYTFAKRGRKEDILYRESYKSFENIATYLFDIISVSEAFKFAHTTKVKTVIVTLEEWENLEKELIRLSKSQPNKRNLVLLSQLTREFYSATENFLAGSTRDVQEAIKKVKSSEGIKDDYTPEWIPLNNMVAGLGQLAGQCQDSAFKDLNLPRR